MKCPRCVAEGRKSYVSIFPDVVTAAYYPPFYDEDGVYHHHDYNQRRRDYTCSNGHEWSEIILRPCPAPGCAWTNETETTKNPKS